MKVLSWCLLQVLTLLVVLTTVLAGCTTTTQGPDGREVRAASEPADPERRARVRLELAGLYFGRGQSSTALEEVKLALAAKPDLADGHNLRGLILASLGDAKAAEESFLRALQLAPQDGGARHNYAWFLCQQRRFADADLQFQRVITAPQYGDLVRSLLAQGVCQARSGQWAEAERTLARSYELDPANPMTAFNLAEVLLHRGQFERARFYVRRVNAVAEQVSAQSLWLAARVERKLNNEPGVQSLGQQLRDRYPQSPETQLFEKGRFDE